MFVRFSLGKGAFNLWNGRIIRYLFVEITTRISRTVLPLELSCEFMKFMGKTISIPRHGSPIIASKNRGAGKRIQKKFLLLRP